MSNFAKIGYCPICGTDKLKIPNEEYPYFKCTKCQQWMGVMTCEYWEVEHIIQKLNTIKKIKLGDVKREDVE